MTTITATESNQKRIDLLCYLFLIFLTGCLVGWGYEEIFYWITEGLLRNRGILYGPWLPSSTLSLKLAFRRAGS